jgi:hypothetical protein
VWVGLLRNRVLFSRNLVRHVLRNLHHARLMILLSQLPLIVFPLLFEL